VRVANAAGRVQLFCRQLELPLRLLRVLKAWTAKFRALVKKTGVN
jgi:hypothetical protein